MLKNEAILALGDGVQVSAIGTVPSQSGEDSIANAGSICADLNSKTCRVRWKLNPTPEPNVCSGPKSAEGNARRHVVTRGKVREHLHRAQVKTQFRSGTKRDSERHVRAAHASCGRGEISGDELRLRASIKQPNDSPAKIRAYRDPQKRVLKNQSP